LEQFNGIRSLKLSGNAIRNLLVLERLTELEQLWLDNNNIVDPIPVLRMPSLRRLDLADNPRLQCPALAQIPLNMQVTLPVHCDAI
jgi:Leucine-rich repeat (LRR) protein